MMGKKDMTVRVDKNSWIKARMSLPGMTDKEISKVLLNTSVIKVKDPIGNFLFGKETWKKFKPITKDKKLLKKIRRNIQIEP